MSDFFQLVDVYVPENGEDGISLRPRDGFKQIADPQPLEDQGNVEVYLFDTAAEVDAFLEGVEAACADDIQMAAALQGDHAVALLLHTDTGGIEAPVAFDRRTQQPDAPAPQPPAPRPRRPRTGTWL
jgi:hypothetical protein